MSSTVPSRDRRQLLLAAGATLNGIDYVEVTADQTHLYVHFLNDVAVGGTLAATTPVTITGGEVIPTVAVEPFDPTTAITADSEGRPILALSVAAPGDFSTYQLSIASSALDPFLASADFSFKAGCPSDLDCAPTAAGCPPPESEPVTIDYLAKDFQSFTQALTEFSNARYPAWQERSEADLGMVLMEALAALADELSYLQDRVSAEASIVTATQRVSVLRHARLVDYEPAPATAATTQLQLDVTAAGVIDSPLHCKAVGSDGSTIDFEVGAGLADAATGTERRITFPVDPRWNRYDYGPGSETSPNLQTYWWDDSEMCLAAGATELYLLGQGHGLYAGQQLLLDTAAPDSTDPPVRELVTVTATSDVTDALLGNELTQVSLAGPTTSDHGLSATTVAGNLVPAVQGLRATDSFYVPGDGPPADPAATPAVVRTGANWTPDDPLPDYRYCLAGDPLAWIAVDATAALPMVIDGSMTAGEAILTSATANFTATDVEAIVSVQGAGVNGNALTTAIQAWTDAGTVTLAAPADTTVSGAAVVLGTAAATTDGDVSVSAVPELVLIAQPPSGPPAPWQFVRWLLGAGAGVKAFTLTPERYSPVLVTGSTTYFDYDGDEGTTIRFGDGAFGLTPAPGTLFSAVYRVGAGAIGNVAADTIVNVAPGQSQGPLIRACTNPFAAAGGADAETITHVAQAAPQQFSLDPLTLVKPADYAAAAQSLPFVQQAGTSFRWTGSWLTAFTIANPMGGEQPAAAQLESVTDLLDRRRMAGYESYVLPPRYVSIDLSLIVCADPAYFAAAVQAAVIARLVPGALSGGGVGFFDHSQWSFGAPLQSSALFAAVQSCVGVAGILSAQFRQRGAQLTWTELPDSLIVAADQILRVDDDPSRPDAGLLTVTVEGGK